ncbi:MAG TPA: ABC transporter permease [Acidimicrobiia bacterium]
MTFVARGASHADSADAALTLPPSPPAWKWLGSRIATFCLAEIQKIRHDRTELLTRAIQPALWLLIFGVTFDRLHAIPTGHIDYLDFLTPGILAQSGMFVAVFYGIQVIWERDAGVLAKLLVTPTPRAALVTGKAFAASIRAFSQVIVILVLARILGVNFTANPLGLILAALAVVLGSAFFATLSLTIAGLAMTRERLMGIGQAITMPLFFASNALYPVSLMPPWIRAFSKINPLSYEVNALRRLLLGTPGNLLMDFGVLVFALVLGVTVAAAILPRLVR